MRVHLTEVVRHSAWTHQRSPASGSHGRVLILCVRGFKLLAIFTSSRFPLSRLVLARGATRRLPARCLSVALQFYLPVFDLEMFTPPQTQPWLASAVSQIRRQLIYIVSPLGASRCVEE